VNPFGQRLDSALDVRGSLCVGIDPHRALLESWELPYDVEGLARFADICVRAFGSVAAVVKPQSAFFEVFGSAGIAVLETTLGSLRDAGAISVLDVKRGDIGSTMAAYASAYLDPASVLAADAITVSPFLGVGSLQPAFDLAHENGRGVFVLALTSNPEGPQIQHAANRDGVTVAQTIVNELAERNSGANPMGPFGIVVGATIGDARVSLSDLNGPYLVPGVGAQGGTADDVRRIFGAARRHVVPSVSRDVLLHGPDVVALRDAAKRQIEDFAFLRL
jgi:orotidine-5'-phosphate decarboxylase